MKRKRSPSAKTSESERPCTHCQQLKAIEEFPIANGQGYRRHVCRPCYSAQKNKQVEAPRMVVYDQSTGCYVEYKPVRMVEKPAKRVDKVLQFVARQGLIVFKMKLGG